MKLKNPPKFVYNAYLNYCKLTGPFRMKPDFIIIGSEKCGTTSLYEYLKKHPSVVASKGKEVSFFDKNFHRGDGWYRSFFPSLLTKYFKKIITFEATPRYFIHPHAAERISKLYPNVKLIVLFRNPVDRAYSHYEQETIYAGRETLPFEDALEKENERISKEYEKMEQDENYYPCSYYWFSHKEGGMYFKHLTRWMKFFSKEQFLFVKSEDLFTNPTETYNEILKWLELSPYELSEYKIYKERNYREKLDSTMREKLNNFFQSHNEQLYKFLNRDFNWK